MAEGGEQPRSGRARGDGQSDGWLARLAERRLLRRLQEHDERAFSQFVAAEQQRVFALASRLLLDPAEAEDVAQEVFVSVFKSIGDFRGGSRLSTWLYRITVNLCHNRRRDRQRRGHGRTESLVEGSEGGDAEGQAPSAANLAPAAANPEQALLGAEADDIFRAAVASLDEEQRTILVLRDVEELAYQEIATITGLAEGTVKSRLHRARAALKSRLTGAAGSAANAAIKPAAAAPGAITPAAAPDDDIAAGSAATAVITLAARAGRRKKESP